MRMFHAFVRDVNKDLRLLTQIRELSQWKIAIQILSNQTNEYNQNKQE